MILALIGTLMIGPFVGAVVAPAADDDDGTVRQTCVVVSTDDDAKKAEARTLILRKLGDNDDPKQRKVRKVIRGQGAAMRSDDGAGPVVLFRLGDTTAQSGEARLFIAGDDEPVVTRSVRPFSMTLDEVDLPKVWIGVRISPIPAPLAAHIGDEGVMIANVFIDSPADQAGIQRYDVIRRFGDHEVIGVEDLTESVAKSEAGQPVKVVLIREGKKERVEITPADRPKDFDYRLKYEEPEQAAIDEDIQMRGRAFQLGPDGRWIVRDLGQMAPDALKEFEIQLQLDPEDGTWDAPFGGGFDIHDLVPPHVLDLPDLDTFMIRPLGPDDEDDADAGPFDIDGECTVSIVIAEDGNAITVECKPDGTVRVTREKDGERTESVYESRKELEAEDPEAAKLLGRFRVGVRGQRAPTPFAIGPVIRMRSALPQMQKLREEFQIDVHEKLQKALEQFHKARERADADHARAMDEARQALERARQALTRPGGKQVDAADTDELVGVRVQPDGKVTVVLRGKEGRIRKLHFDNEDEFAEEMPELHKKASGMFE